MAALRSVIGTSPVACSKTADRAQSDRVPASELCCRRARQGRRLSHLPRGSPEARLDAMLLSIPQRTALSCVRRDILLCWSLGKLKRNHASRQLPAQASCMHSGILVAGAAIARPCKPAVEDPLSSVTNEIRGVVPGLLDLASHQDARLPPAQLHRMKQPQLKVCQMEECPRLNSRSDRTVLRRQTLREPWWSQPEGGLHVPLTSEVPWPSTTGQA